MLLAESLDRIDWEPSIKLSHPAPSATGRPVWRSRSTWPPSCIAAGSLALVSAVWTLGPSMFQHREVIFFCDNSSPLGAAMNGYTSSSHMASLSNALHLGLAALRSSAFECVPSDANCADLPSRPQGVAEQQFYDDLGLNRWPGGLRFSNDKQLSDPQLRDVFAR